MKSAKQDQKKDVGFTTPRFGASDVEFVVAQLSKGPVKLPQGLVTARDLHRQFFGD